MKFPSQWDTVSIGEGLSLINGRAFKPTEWVRDGLPIIRIQNLNDRDAPYNYYQGGLPEKFKVKKGDLLFAWSGTPGTSFGAHIWRGDEAWLNQHIFRVTFPEKLFDKQFLQLAINQNLREYVRAAHGGAGLAHITKGKFESSILPTPPLAEQRRIVAKIEELFSELDQGIENLKLAQAQLTVYRQALLKHAFEGKLTTDWRAKQFRTNKSRLEDGADLLASIRAESRRLWEDCQLQKFREAGKEPPEDWKSRYREPTEPDISALQPLPQGWAWATPRHLGDVQLGRQRAPQHHNGNNMRKYLRVANVHEDRIDLKSVYEMNFTPDEFKTFELRNGDILLNEGQSFELVGRSAIYRDELPGACFTNTLVRFRAYKGIMPEFAQNYFKACLRNHRFRKLARRTTNIAHLGADRFAAMEFPVPPQAEQQAIVEILEAQFSVVNHLESDIETNLQKAETLRQSILKKAFAGELVPQDPDDEPAAALLARIRAERESAAAAKHGRARHSVRAAHDQGGQKPSTANPKS